MPIRICTSVVQVSVLKPLLFRIDICRVRSEVPAPSRRYVLQCSGLLAVSTWIYLIGIDMESCNALHTRSFCRITRCSVNCNGGGGSVAVAR